MKLFKAKFIISFFLIIFLLGNILIFSENSLSQNIKKKIPNEYKEFLKKNVFFISNIIKENQKIKSENNKLYQKIYQLEKAKNLTNYYFFPETNFLQLSYSEIPIEFENRVVKKIYGDLVYPFYIDVYKENLIFANKEGNFFFEKIENLLNNKIQNKYIISNLPNSNLTDIIVIDDFLYVALAKKDKNGCIYNDISIYKAKIDLKKMNFIEVLDNKYNFIAEDGCNLDLSPTGGALAYSDKDDNLFFSGNFSLTKKKYTKKEEKFNLDKGDNFLKTNKSSSIFVINLKNNKPNLVSTGHRNPLGLLVNSNNKIISTEHGPRGGDEINNIIQGKNYGWPEVSYGEPYSTKPESIYYYKKNHKKYGYEEPIFSFIPSIAISKIIEIDNQFSEKWQNNYFVSSLKDRSLYRIELSDEGDKIKYMEKMHIGKRIRDISYDKNKKVFFLALEDNPSKLGLFFKK